MLIKQLAQGLITAGLLFLTQLAFRGGWPEARQAGNCFYGLVAVIERVMAADPAAPAAQPPPARAQAPAPAGAAKSDPAKDLTQYLMAVQCGVCHSGAARVVAKLEIEDFGSLEKHGYVTPGAPEKSKLWLKVRAQEMPPQSFGELAGEQRETIRKLIARLEVRGGDRRGPRPRPPANLHNLVATGESDPRLRTFVAWGKQAKLDDELIGLGPFTILAPTNEAIDRLGPENLRFLNENPGHLASVLINHALFDSREMAELARAGKVDTMGSTYPVQQREDIIWIGDAQLVEPDVKCSNGVIHVIDKVLLPASIARLLPVQPETRIVTGNIKLLVLPGGEFVMGSPPDEEGRFEDEGPQHRVALDPFEVSTTEISRRQYFGIMFHDPSDENMPGRREQSNDDPVQCVNWFEAVRFCNELSRIEKVEPYYVLTLRGREGPNGKPVYEVTIPDPSGCGYRLLTEAEWEYACRAGSQTAYCFGDDPAQLPDFGWIDIAQKTQPVAQLKPNAFGLFDMHGNVGEWCQDWYNSSYENAQAVINPMGPSEGDRRVVRGGSYIHGAAGARCAARHQARPPWWVHRSIGFRIGRYLPPEREPDLEGLARGGRGEEGEGE